MDSADGIQPVARFAAQHLHGDVDSAQAHVALCVVRFAGQHQGELRQLHFAPIQHRATGHKTQAQQNEGPLALIAACGFDRSVLAKRVVTGFAGSTYAPHSRLDIVQTAGLGRSAELCHFGLHLFGIVIEFCLVGPDFWFSPVITAFVGAFSIASPRQFGRELGHSGAVGCDFSRQMVLCRQPWRLHG